MERKYFFILIGIFVKRILGRQCRCVKPSASHATLLRRGKSAFRTQIRRGGRKRIKLNWLVE